MTMMTKPLLVDGHAYDSFLAIVCAFHFCKNWLTPTEYILLGTRDNPLHADWGPLSEILLVVFVPEIIGWIRKDFLSYSCVCLVQFTIIEFRFYVGRFRFVNCDRKLLCVTPKLSSQTSRVLFFVVTKVERNVCFAERQYIAESFGLSTETVLANLPFVLKRLCCHNHRRTSFSDRLV